MSKFPEKLNLGTVSGLLFVLIIGVTGTVMPILAADKAARNQAADQNQKIRITADRLVANTKTGHAEFIGNVRATQGSTVITSDRLEVHYDQGGQPGATAESETAIKSIVASGNVVIHFDDKVATTNKAVYDSKTGVFTLAGRGTRVTSGDNTITGEKISVDRKNDHMTVVGGKTSRVNAVIYADQGGLAAPQPGKTAVEEPGRQQ